VLIGFVNNDPGSTWLFYLYQKLRWVGAGWRRLRLDPIKVVRNLRCEALYLWLENGRLLFYGFNSLEVRSASISALSSASCSFLRRWVWR